MFHLKIQPAEQPEENLVPGSKVRRGVDLMYGPFFADVPGFICNGKGHAFHDVGQLKDHAGSDSANDGGNDKPGQGAGPAYNNGGEDNVDRHVPYFTYPENKMFPEFHPRLLIHVGYAFPGKIASKIQVKYPGNVGDHVEDYPIEMLEPVKPIARLMFMEAHQGTYFDISIMTFDVRVGMVIDIMLYLPEMRIASQYVKRVGGNRIEPAMFGKTPVTSLVHDVEPDDGEAKTETGAQQLSPKHIQHEEIQSIL